MAILGFVVLLMALVTSDVPSVQANATQYDYFKAAYPSSPLSGFSSTVLPSNGCLICHPTGAGPGATPQLFFNVYGAAFGALPHSTQSAAIAALHSIDSANSDNDGPTINVSKVGTGSGTVTSAPGGVSCGATCTASFPGVGGAVTLTASPAAGSTFAGWSGGGTPGCSGTGTCAVRSDNLTEITLGTFPGDSGSRPTVTVTATFTAVAFNYSLANTGAINVTQGQSGGTSINATLVSGAAQSVSFSASGLPAGATAGFSPGSCNPTCSSTLTISTIASTAPGTYQLTVTGNPLSKSTTLNLVVTATATPFSYSLTSSGPLTVARGTAGTSTVTAALTSGATQPVSFSVSGLPSGATAGFSPAECSPTCTTQLTIGTTASTPIGTFPVTVTGNSPSRTTSFDLTISAPSPGADLVVTGLTAPTAGTIGGMLDGVSVTVRNQGSAVAGGHRLGLYYSTDPTITAGDSGGGFCTMPPINPGETKACGGLVAVPGSLTPGTYYLGALVDDLGEVPEANEQNNARAADTGPVMVIPAAGTPSVILSLNQTVFAAGNVLSLTLTTQPGGLTAAADFYLVLLVPGGFAYLFDGTSFALIFDGTHVFSEAVKPFRAGAPVTNVSRVILGAMVPDSIPHGTYTFLAVLVRAGADPLDTSNWLAPSGQATFSF